MLVGIVFIMLEIYQGRRSIFLSGGAENERQRREFVGGSGGIPLENFEI